MDSVEQTTGRGRMLPVAEVAARLSLAPRSVLELIYSGRLAATNVGLGDKRPVYRIPEAILAEYLASRVVTPRRPAADSAKGSK